MEHTERSVFVGGGVQELGGALALRIEPGRRNRVVLKGHGPFEPVLALRPGLERPLEEDEGVGVLHGGRAPAEGPVDVRQDQVVAPRDRFGFGHTGFLRRVEQEPAREKTFRDVEANGRAVRCPGPDQGLEEQGRRIVELRACHVELGSRVVQEEPRAVVVDRTRDGLGTLDPRLAFGHPSQGAFHEVEVQEGVPLLRSGRGPVVEGLERPMIPAGRLLPATSLLQHVAGADGRFGGALAVAHGHGDLVRFAVVPERVLEQAQRTLRSASSPQCQGGQRLVLQPRGFRMRGRREGDRTFVPAARFFEGGGLEQRVNRPRPISVRCTRDGRQGRLDQRFPVDRLALEEFLDLVLHPVQVDQPVTGGLQLARPGPGAVGIRGAAAQQGAAERPKLLHVGEEPLKLFDSEGCHAWMIQRAR